MKSTDIRAAITKSIIQSIESGVKPWARGWSEDPNGFGLAKSLSSGANYRGINQWLLQAYATENQISSSWFGSFNCIRHLGASVRKGERAVKILLWKPVARERLNKQGETVEDRVMIMRSYSVFSVEQTTGLGEYRVGFSQSTQPKFERFAKADDLFAATGAEIGRGGSKAYFCPKRQHIQIPFESQFETPEHYYSTLAHEFIHWSERHIGIDRSQPETCYNFLELVAELGSCQLLGELGIGTIDLGNSSAYIESWLRSMNSDTSYVLRASSVASKAVDFLLSFLPQETVETNDAIPF